MSVRKEDLICTKYKALYKDTFASMYAATGNREAAEGAAIQRVLGQALLSIGEARRELVVIENIQHAFDLPMGALDAAVAVAP